MQSILLQQVLLFISGAVVGFLIGWLAHGWYTKRFIHGISQKVLFSSIVIVLWASASVMSMYNGYDIPLFLHIFAGIILASMFDPEGKIIDKIWKR